MRIKGLEKFREKVPALGGKRLILLPLYWLVFLVMGIAVMRRFDALPAGFPLLGELTVGTAGLVLVWQMWFWRKRLKARYGRLSYQHIFFVGFAGIALVMSLSVNQFFRFFPPALWTGSPLEFLILPPEAFWPSLGPQIFWARMILAVFFTGLGLALVLRSLQTFGLDYMAVVYLYFPEESSFQHHEIYSVLRHPAYASIIFIGLGGTFTTAALYSVIFFAVIVTVFSVHVHFVEERELVERFGVSYREYMKQVPAFFVKPDKTFVLLRFLGVHV